MAIKSSFSLSHKMKSVISSDFLGFVLHKKKLIIPLVLVANRRRVCCNPAYQGYVGLQRTRRRLPGLVSCLPSLDLISNAGSWNTAFRGSLP